MNKNVIALAVAAAMLAPLAAQAEVKVSGVLQAELDSVSGDTAEGLYLTSGNRGKVEFKASEDLGNGLKAIAKYGMNANVDGKAISQRDAFVGLSGSFGTVLAGTMSNPYKSSTVSWDPFLETGAQARGQNGMSTKHNGYTGNAIAYANKFGMAKVVAALVLDETADTGTTPAGTSTTGNHGMSIAVNMPVGPVEVAVAYIDTSDMGVGTGGTATTDSAVKLGVKYSAGAMGVAVQHETLDTGADDNTTYTYLNGTYAAGANTFAAAFGVKDDGTNSDTYTSLGMIHSFSKSTLVYAAYVASANENGGNGAETDVSALAFGLRVGF